MKSIIKKLAGRQQRKPGKQKYPERSQQMGNAIVQGDYPFIKKNFNELFSQPTHFFHLALENNHSFIVWTLLLRKCQIETTQAWLILFGHKKSFVTLKLMLELNFHKKSPIEEFLHLCQDLETLRYGIVHSQKPENVHWRDSLFASAKQDLIQSQQLPAEKKSELTRTIEIEKFNNEFEEAYLKISSANQPDLKDPVVILFLANLKFGYYFLKQIQIFPEGIISIVLDYLAFHMFTTVSATYANWDYLTALDSLAEQKETFFRLSQFFVKPTGKKPDPSNLGNDTTTLST